MPNITQIITQYYPILPKLLPNITQIITQIITQYYPNYYPNYYPKKSKLLDDLFMMIIRLENIYYFFFQDSKMKKNKNY